MIVSKITSGIRVEVEPHFLPDYSNPLQDQYMFSYKIKISNGNPFAVKLVHRNWGICDSLPDYEKGCWRDIEGDGVLGMQPIIEPGGEYEYVSGANLNTPFGMMGGYYTFARITDKATQPVVIPTFKLEAPQILN